MSKDKGELVVGSVEWTADLMAKRFTKEWQPAVLSLLEKDEFIENYPSTDGLARIGGLIFGPYNVHVQVVHSPSPGDRSATVHVRVSNASGIYESAADVSDINTKKPFSLHPVATAETKAFGRALKKMLAIKIHTHEEMLGDDSNYEKLTEQQVRAVENLTKKMGLDVEAFLAEHAGVSLDLFKSGVSGLTKEHGIKLLEKLNELQNKK